MKHKAIIVDLDGTLVQSLNPNLFIKPTGGTDWDGWMASNRFATVNEWCKEIVLAMHRRGYKILFLTARNGSSSGREITKEWLDSHFGHEGIHDYELIMRPDEDFRPDTDVKLMLYRDLVANSYDVLLAIDDKKHVIDLWRNLNIPALHCADY